MNRKHFTLLIWTAIGVQVVFELLSAALKIATPATIAAPGNVYSGPLQNILEPIFVVFGLLATLTFPLVGAVIFTRRPNLRVGWLFCLSNIGWAFNNLVGNFALYAYTAHPAWMPLAAKLVWFYMWPGLISVGLMTYLLLIFPDGRLISTRWRTVAWVVLADTVIGVISAAFARGPIDSSLGVPLSNPLGFPGFLGQVFYWISNQSPFPMIMIILIILAGISLIVRYRSSSGVIKLQLRWLAASMVVVALFMTVQMALLIVYPFSPAMPPGAQAALFLSEISLALIPISAGIAILRYHLYEIDRLINRALVYATLTLTLALIYFGSVVTLQMLLRLLTGRAESPLVTVVSTLAIAALFAPLRRRIQRGIDQRFYRRKYDSERILSAFGSTLRSEVDLDRLSDQFLRVVGETFEPRETQLWLKPARKTNSLINIR